MNIFKYIINYPKIYRYNSLIKKIQEDPKEQLYVCNYINKYYHKEYFLFRDQKHEITSIWLTNQLIYDCNIKVGDDNFNIESNEYRVFMLQLCIEMLK